MGVVARDIMQAEVHTVGLDASLSEVYSTFVEEEISGAPVINDSGSVCGVISIRDLLRAVEEENGHARDESYYFREYAQGPRPDWVSDLEDFQDRLSRRVASEVMTARVISVKPNTSASKVAKLVRAHHIHRVLVIDGDELVGLISLFDLVELLE